MFSSPCRWHPLVGFVINISYSTVCSGQAPFGNPHSSQILGPLLSSERAGAQCRLQGLGPPSLWVTSPRRLWASGWQTIFLSWLGRPSGPDLHRPKLLPPVPGGYLTVPVHEAHTWFTNPARFQVCVFSALWYLGHFLLLPKLGCVCSSFGENCYTFPVHLS